MTAGAEAQLWAAHTQAGDASAREALIVEYMSLAQRTAQKCPASGAADSLEDAISESYVALIECIDRFDPALGVSFYSMAIQRIRGAITDHVRRKTPGSRSQCPMRLVPMSSCAPSGEDNEDSQPEGQMYAQPDPVQDLLDQQTDQCALGEILTGLTTAERCVLILKVFESASHQAIATGMGFSYTRSAHLISSVKKKLLRIYTGPGWPWRDLH